MNAAELLAMCDRVDARNAERAERDRDEVQAIATGLVCTLSVDEWRTKYGRPA